MEARVELTSGLKVPRNLGEITPLWLTQALDFVRGRPGMSVTGYSAEAIVEGKGFMNRLFRLDLEYGPGSVDLPRTVVAKLPSADPMLRSVFDRMRQNRREVMFYRELAHKIQLPVPVSYHCGMAPDSEDTVLLLEDLSSGRQGNSVTGCSMAEARACIGQLARFQAAWWESPLLDSLHWMPLREAEAGVYLEIYDEAWGALVEKAAFGMPRSLQALGDRLAPLINKLKAELTRPPRTIVHGDYRLDNCFFPAEPDGRQVVAFDWEFCVRGRGVYDVATFISEAFPPQKRREAEMGLLREYHAVLVDGGVRGYSFQECLEDYRLSVLEIFAFWVITGGYCSYEGERATRYLINTLGRIDAAITDLDSIATLDL